MNTKTNKNTIQNNNTDNKKNNKKRNYKNNNSKSSSNKKQYTRKNNQNKKNTNKQKQIKQTRKVVEKPKINYPKIDVLETIKEQKNKKIKLKRIYILIIIVLSILLAISIGIEVSNIISPSENLLPTTPNKENKQPTEEMTEEEKEWERINNLFTADIDFNIPRTENNNQDIVARLEIPGVFNLLLTQTKDNDYYLEYNIKKKRSNKGTEFIDFRNKLTDNQINIYGHNSRLYDLPFKNLEKFLDKEFFDNNEYILLQHEGGRRIYRIAAIKKVKTDNEHMIVEAKDHKSHIEKLLKNTINSREIEYNESSNIIVLQTCVRQDDGSYYVLIGIEKY